MNDNFRIALLANTQLTERDLVSEIKAADKTDSFDCAIHLGNIITGNNPEKISDRLYIAELEKYKNCTESGMLYVAQGKTDGYRNERFLGQLAINITTDEKWTKRASTIDCMKTQLFGKPYYYVDFPSKKVRLLFLCPYLSELDEENEIYVKFEGFDTSQIAWILNDAAKLEKGWRAVLFSHTIPHSVFSGDKDPLVYHGKSTDPFLRAVQHINEHGAKVAAHFCGTLGNNDAYTIGGVNRISIGNLWQEIEIGDDFVRVGAHKYSF